MSVRSTVYQTVDDLDGNDTQRPECRMSDIPERVNDFETLTFRI